MPYGTQFVYLGILLVYSYLVNSSTKTRGSYLVYSYLVNLLTKKELNYFFFLTSFLPITWFV